ncbi:hypothetical protein OA92_10005 [Marinomonas sp. SBI22]|uniref:hypothetical protein n=1 Tax=unclassified Marinomonas TaxID=196814 RepID=UPI0007AEFD1A|nr:MULTISPECIES: hypothetical protein [unclassified Marinomonas]KZM43084.1 hypothetical protein OA92_10005 [Marinomonas sp. SBI22]KZM44655.1 hypothetical protein OA91_09430 [Marinomonas sp. SBI8L]
MKVGKQSVKNDLEALDQKIDQKFEEAKQVNVEIVSNLANGSVSSGELMDQRPDGIYQLIGTGGGSIENATQIGMEGTNETNGVGMFMSGSATSSAVMLFISWSGKTYAVSKRNGVNYPSELLSTKNTIVDANGFIKTA